MTCLPASAAAIAKSPCVPLGVNTPTTSTSSRAINSAGEVVQAQSHSAPRACAVSARRSQTARKAAPSVARVILARLAPIPVPIIPKPTVLFVFIARSVSFRRRDTVCYHSRTGPPMVPLTRVGKRMENATVGARHAVPLPWAQSAWAPSSNKIPTPVSRPDRGGRRRAHKGRFFCRGAMNRARAPRHCGASRNPGSRLAPCSRPSAPSPNVG